MGRPTPASEILASIGQNGATSVTIHDVAVVRFSAVPAGYDPTNRPAVFDYLYEQQGKGEVVNFAGGARAISRTGIRHVVG